MNSNVQNSVTKITNFKKYFLDETKRRNENVFFQDLIQEQSSSQRLGQELRSSTQQILDLQENLDNLQRTHDEEMGEMVDVVNDLKQVTLKHHLSR